jgi:hypothetical protein
MANKQIIDSWSKIEPDRTADARMLDAIISRNHSGISKATLMTKTFNWKWLTPVAACLIVAFAVALPFLSKGNSDFDLKMSNGVTVSYVDNIPDSNPGAQLVFLSEDELFGTTFDRYEIVAFEGTVKEIRNVVCDYNGAKDYRAIATIDVSEVLRGDIKAGETVTVLLPAPVGTELQVEDTDVSSQLAVGTTGIFMPIKYDETSTREENGKTLALLDLADYGLIDGVRWAFIETASGLVYDNNAYPSLSDARTLDEAKAVILSKLK